MLEVLPATVQTTIVLLLFLKEIDKAMRLCTLSSCRSPRTDTESAALNRNATPLRSEHDCNVLYTTLYLQCDSARRTT
jgi:hypothetical protein